MQVERNGITYKFQKLSQCKLMRERSFEEYHQKGKFRLRETLNLEKELSSLIEHVAVAHIPTHCRVTVSLLQS